MEGSAIPTNPSNAGLITKAESGASNKPSSLRSPQPVSDSNRKVPVESDKLKYVLGIENLLKAKNINFNRQEKSLLCHQRYYRDATEEFKELLIPGSRSAVKHFLAVKFTQNRVFITICSRRLVFNQEFEPDLTHFINFMNLSDPLGQFYIAGGPEFHHPNKCILSSRKMIYNLGKISLVEEIVDEIVAYEKVYLMTIMEFLPQFLSRYHIYRNVFSNVIKKYDVSRTSVTKAIKGMGFNQDKQTDATTPLGKVFTLAAAVNTEPWQKYNQPTWKVLQITIEVTEYFITLKIKMNEKQAFKNEDEALHLKLSSFINIVNADLKRAQFRINFQKFYVTLEANIVTAGLNHTEIQASFQDLFSYMMCVFKKYSEAIYNITEINGVSNLNNSVPTNSRESYRDGSTSHAPSSSNDLFLDLNRNRMYGDSNDYSLFYIGNASKSKIYLIIPKTFKTISFTEKEFMAEKFIIEKLNSCVDESYHIHLDEQKFTVKYPVYTGCTFQDSIKTVKEAAIHTMYTFILKLQQNGFEVNKIMKNLSIFKEGGHFFAYFSKFPLHSYITYSDQPISKVIQQNTCLMLTRKIFKVTTSNFVQPKKITFLQESSFEKLPNQTSEFLIDTFVEFVPIKMEEIIELEKSAKTNYSIIDSHLGFIKRDNQYFLVREQLIPVNFEVVAEKNICEYFNEILDAIILVFTLRGKALMITEEDIYLSQKNKLRLRFKEYSDDHNWKIFKGNNQEEQQVYFLALLLYKMLTRADPFVKLLNIDPNLLREQINSRIRIPILPWEFENSKPKIASFLKGCWDGEIITLADMKSQFPFKI